MKRHLGIIHAYFTKWNKQSERLYPIQFQIHDITGKIKTMDAIKRWAPTGEQGGREINWQSTDNL